jgi:hypothetical protein
LVHFFFEALWVSGQFHPCFVSRFLPIPFHHRRSLTCGYESYALSGRSAFSKADGFSDARRASLHSVARRASLQEVRRIVFHSALKKELTLTSHAEWARAFTDVCGKNCTRVKIKKHCVKI